MYYKVTDPQRVYDAVWVEAATPRLAVIEAIAVMTGCAVEGIDEKWIADAIRTYVVEDATEADLVDFISQREQDEHDVGGEAGDA